MHTASQFVVYGAALLQTRQGAHADPRPLPKFPTMGTCASELDQGQMEDDSLV